jgi:hypothetical protein
MSSAAEAFVTALARASKRAGKFLRGLSKHDRDDVIATALLDCWEHRADYNIAQPLDDWFMDALRAARRAFKRGEYVTAEEFNQEMAVPDDTSVRAQAVEAADILAAAFSDREHLLLADVMVGMSWRDVARKHNASGQEVGGVTRKLNRLRDLIPSRQEVQRTIRKFAPSFHMDASEPGRETQIDRDLARLEFPPPHSKDCPPCWRCLWYMGFMPAKYTKRTTAPADADVQAAVWAIENRKIAIAGAIQSGTLGDLR